MGDLADLAGVFAGTDRIQASPWSPGASARVQVESIWEVAQSVLVQRWQDAGPSYAFESLNLFMTDPATGEVLLYAFDTVGYPPDPPARGTWTQDQLVLQRVTDRGQSQMQFTLTDDGFRWSKVYRRDDQEPWQLIVEGQLERVGEATAHAAPRARE